MKKFLLSIALLLSGIVSAQVTIQSTDMPSLNDTVRYSISADDVSTLLNDTGRNRNWNFSFLTPTFQDIHSFKSAASINIGYALSFATSSYGLKDNDLNFTLVQAQDVYNFYKNSTAGFVGDGRGFTAQGLPLTQTYSGSKDVIYRFPMNYGNKDSCVYTSSEANILIASIVSTGKRRNVVDGWGSVTTPYGTFNCLRVKSVIQRVDTLKNQFFPLPITSNITEYKWIAKSQKIPVVEVVVTSGGLGGGQTSIKYRDINRPEVFIGKAQFSANKTSFAVNAPEDTCILTSNSPNSPKSYQWTISPATYSFLGGTNASSQRAKVFFTAKGTYTVKLKVVYNAGQDEAVYTDYITVSDGPVANFVVDNRQPQVVSVVNFYDSSEGNPNKWKWNFTPTTVSYVGGTTSTSQNPKVTFDQKNVYSVSLTVTNAIGSNTVTRNNYINAVNAGLSEVQNYSAFVSIFPNPSANQFFVNSTKGIMQRMELYDYTGRKLDVKMTEAGNASYIDLQDKSQGIYTLKIYFDNDAIATKQLMISK